MTPSEGLRQGRQHDAPVPDMGRRVVLSAAYQPAAAAAQPVRDQGLGLVWRAAIRLAVPVIALLALLALAYLYRDEPAAFFDVYFPNTSRWLSLGALFVPLTFFALHLTSRRYGPAIAASQIAIAWVIVIAVAVARGLSPTLEIATPSANAARIGVALCVSLMLAQFAAVIAFDAMRSVRWWTAPVHGWFWASLVFVVTFYPAAYLGSGTQWFSHMAIYLAVSLFVSFGSLIAYWVVRPLVPPMPGLAGY